MKKRDHLALIGILVMSLILFSSISSYSTEVRGVTHDTIKLGIIADMTGPGVANTVPMANAIKYYFRYVNEQGGIHGRKIIIRHEDDRYSPPMALAAFKKLVFKDKIMALISIVTTGGTLPLIPRWEKEKLPTISVNSAYTVTTPVKRYIFTVRDTYENNCETPVHYIMKDLNAKKPIIGILRIDNPSGKVASNGVMEGVKFYGLRHHEEVIAPGAIEATSQVLNMKMAKADYVVILGIDSTATTFMNSSRTLGYKPKKFIGSFFSNSEAIVKTVGKAAKNFISENPFASWGDESPGMKQMMKIVERYAPGKKKTVAFTEGWGTSMPLAEAMKRAGKGLNSESLVEALESMKNFDTGGLTGLITWGPDDHKGGGSTRFLKADVEKGTLVPITGWGKTGPGWRKGGL